MQEITTSLMWKTLSLNIPYRELQIPVKSPLKRLTLKEFYTM